MKKDVHLKGMLRLYMQWPAVMSILLIAMNLWIYSVDKRAGVIMSLFVALPTAKTPIMESAAKVRS